MNSEAWAVAGSSFAACVAEGEVSYAPATAATSATAGCLRAVPCGIATYFGASAAAFPELYGSAEALLTPVAQTPGGVATGAFGEMGIVEPFLGPGYWIPVVGGLVLNLESFTAPSARPAKISTLPFLRQAPHFRAISTIPRGWSTAPKPILG